MQFQTRIQGIPCICEVLAYRPELPTRVYGPGMEDADPPEEGEFDYRILDRKGQPAPWLEKKINPTLEQELREEADIMYRAREYEMAEMACWDEDEPMSYIQGC